MKTTLKTLIVAFVLFGISFHAVAQTTCPATLKSKTGKVYSAAPGVLEANSSADKVTVKVKKTAGKAETQVNIYVGGRFRGKIEFDNGKYTTGYRSKTVGGATNKKVRVEIVNQSVGNTFSYGAKIEGKNSSLVTSGGRVSGNLAGNIKKTVQTVSSCTGKSKIVMRRVSTSGQNQVMGIGQNNARGTIRVWQKIGNNWVAMNNYNKTVEANENSKIYTVNSTRPLKVELKNISVGKFLKYTLDVVPTN